MKTNKKTPGSFASRLTWRIIGAICLINVIVIACVLLFVMAGATMQSGDRYQQIIDFTDEKLETVLTAVEVSAVNNINEVEDNIDHPDKIYEALIEMLKLNPHVVGCFAAFEPNYFKQTGRWFEPCVYRKDSTNIERMQIGGPEHDYLQREWYEKGLTTTDEGYWSEPYYDNTVNHLLLCSFVLPIHDKHGKAVGVFGIDFPLEWLYEQMRQLEEKENDYYLNDSTNTNKLYCFIIDRKGQYIVHPDKERILKESFLDDVNATPDTLDNLLYRQMMAGNKGELQMRMNGKKSNIYFSPLGRAGWSMAVVVPRAFIYYWGLIIGSLILITMILGGGIFIFIMCMIIIRRATKPLRYLSTSAEEVAKGNFDTPLPLFKHNDEINQLRDSFETMQQSLSQYVDQLKRTTASQASMESELRIAHDIQMSMLPKTFPAFPERDDIDIYGLVNPAKAVGGDLYDFFIRDEKLFFCIGDVSGKGVPASLVMAVTRSLFRNISTHTSKPAHIVSTLNDSLSEGNDANMFVTFFVGVLDLPTGKLLYCNAGHDDPILIDKDSQQGHSSENKEDDKNPFSLFRYSLGSTPNLPIGAMPDSKYAGEEIVIAPGTTIFLYTDGLNEAEDAQHRQFGMERIQQVAHTTPCEPQSLINAMDSAVRQFVGNTEQSDDLTMLAVQYTRKPSATILDRHVTLPNDVQTMPQLSEFVEEVCQAVGLSMSQTMQVNLAVEEAVANVMNYAYPDEKEGEVRIHVTADSRYLQFVLSDDGIPFDPTEHHEVDTTLSADERNIGGLGIHLTKTIMDNINYERRDNQNIFTLRKIINNPPA